MNAISQAGLRLARHLAPAYLDNPKVSAAIAGGSVARGSADVYADLEIGVFWREPPLEHERTAVLARIGGALLSITTADAYAPVWSGNEHYGVEAVVIDGRRYTGTLMISVQHLLVETVETWLADVLARFDTSMEKQELVAAIHDAVPLGGAQLVQRWHAQTAVYPDELARRIIRDNLWFGPWFWPGAYAQRGDALVLHQHLVWMAQALLKLLAALNRIYYRSSEHKWMDRLIDELRTAPPNLAARLKHALQAEPAEGEQQLHALIDETIALVEAQVPDVDQPYPGDEHPWVNLAWARERWQPRPPYTLLGKLQLVEEQRQPDPL